MRTEAEAEQKLNELLAGDPPCDLCKSHDRYHQRVRDVAESTTQGDIAHYLLEARCRNCDFVVKSVPFHK